MKNAYSGKRWKRCLALLVTVSMFASTLIVPAYAKTPEHSDYRSRAQQRFEQVQVPTGLGEEEEDPNEVLRVLVATDIASAVEQTGEIAYTDAVQRAEDIALSAQEEIIRAVEELTGNKVINRSGYLVNTFSIEMTRAQMAIVAEMDGVESVSPVTVFVQQTVDGEEAQAPEADVTETEEDPAPVEEEPAPVEEEPASSEEGEEQAPADPADAEQEPAGPEAGGEEPQDAAEAQLGLESVPGDAAVEPRMATAKDMTTAKELWKPENGGYTGEGIVVAVIDSGANYAHPDMQMDPDAELKYTKSDMEEKIAELGYGNYYSDKVPFGYSYAGRIDNDVNNDSVAHGLHVSGIIAANGNEEEGGVAGIAPDAQIFAMQVFGYSGSANNDDVIAAVEDSVKLGADVINLSLGGTPGFNDDVEYLRKAMKYAEEHGILCCVAAGNSGASSSETGINTNDWEGIDTGSVESPGTYSGALSVASMDNDTRFVPVADILDENGEVVFDDLQVVDFSEGSCADWTGIGTLPIIDCGLGSYDEINAAKEAAGLGWWDPWIALVERGELTFEDKIKYTCYWSYASGVIIYNNEATDEVPESVSAGSYNYYNAIMVSGNAGAKLKEIAAAGGQISVNGLTETAIANPTGNQISSFSCWGPTPTLDIKPEITAPGGYINSISFGDSYEVMSGTSMATPFVSGCSAIVLQALQDAVAAGELKLGGDLKLNQYLKLSQMNTADPVMDGDVIYSVRQQGSGLVDPLAAANNRVLATYNGEAGVALKEIGNTTSFTITLTNYGTTSETYTVPASIPVYTDYTDPATHAYNMRVLEGASVTFSQTTVTVGAGQTATLTGVLNIPAGAERNHFAETFITLSGDIELSLPLMGFYGDWDTCQRIIDLPAWDEDNILTNYYGVYPATTLIGGTSFLGMDVTDGTVNPDNLAFSPNGDAYSDSVQPVVGLLRSAGTITVDILDSEKNVIRRINTLTNVSKTVGLDCYTYRDPYMALNNSLSVEDGTWDGTVYDTRTGSFVMCEEGQYYVRISASLPESDVVEVTDLPVKLDVTAPGVRLTDASYLDGNLVLDYMAGDYSGMMDFGIVYVNGEEYTFTPSQEASYDPESDTYTVTLAVENYSTDKLNEIILYMEDYASNLNADVLFTNAVYDTPVVFSNINNDDSLTYLTDVTYTEIQDESYNLIDVEDAYAMLRGVHAGNVAKITVNGYEASFDDRNGFGVVVPIELGYNDMTVVAFDEAGNEIYRVVRKTLFDVFSPEVEGYVCDENGDWNDEMLYASYETYGGYMFSTKYQSDELVPIAIRAEDESITDITVSWVEGVLTDSEDSRWFWGQTLEDGADRVKTRKFTVEDMDENGLVYVSVPFYKWLRNDEGTDYRYRQIVQISVTDASGNTENFKVITQDNDYGKEMYELNGPGDVREDGIKTIRIGFERLDPLNDENGNFRHVITPEMGLVDENGIMHISGTIEGEDQALVYNGEMLEFEEDGRSFSFDFKVQPGLNTLHLNFLYDMFDHFDGSTLFTTQFYYLTEGEPLTVTFDNEAIEDGAVIYTNEDTFLLSGEIATIGGNLNVKVNGDQLFYLTEAGENLEGVDTRNFSYGVKLSEGENIVTFTATDDTYTEIKLRFTVIQDVTAPEAPQISVDDNYLVTILPGEGEAVTLYYSLDGQVWAEYDGAFEMTQSGTVYAKAVDVAGNESEVVSLAVTVPGTDEPDTPENPPAGDQDNEDPGNQDPGNNKPGDGASEDVNTGDNAPVILAAAALVIALAALVCLGRRKARG